MTNEEQAIQVMSDWITKHCPEALEKAHLYAEPANICIKGASKYSYVFVEWAKKNRRLLVNATIRDDGKMLCFIDWSKISKQGEEPIILSGEIEKDGETLQSLYDWFNGEDNVKS